MQKYMPFIAIGSIIIIVVILLLIYLVPVKPASIENVRIGMKRSEVQSGFTVMPTAVTETNAEIYTLKRFNGYWQLTVRYNCEDDAEAGDWMFRHNLIDADFPKALRKFTNRYGIVD